MRHRWELKVAPGRSHGIPRVSPVPPVRGRAGGRSHPDIHLGWRWQRGSCLQAGSGVPWDLIAPVPSVTRGLPQLCWAELEPPAGASPMLGAYVSGLGHSRCRNLLMLGHGVSRADGMWPVPPATLVSPRAME